VTACDAAVTPYLKVRVVEVVGDVPAQHQELATLDEHRVKVAQTEQQLLVLVRLVTAAELLVTNALIQSLHVRLQTLSPAAFKHITMRHHEVYTETHSTWRKFLLKPKLHLYDLLYNKLYNKSTTNRISGVWA